RVRGVSGGKRQETPRGRGRTGGARPLLAEPAVRQGRIGDDARTGVAAGGVARHGFRSIRGVVVDDDQLERPIVAPKYRSHTAPDISRLIASGDDDRYQRRSTERGRFF